MTIQEKIWEDLEKYAQSIYSKPSFDTWIRYSKMADFNDQEIVISVPSEFVKSRWEEDLVAELQKISEQYMGYPLAIRFQIAEKKALTLEQKETNTQEKPALNPEYTFANFVRGQNNNLAFTAAQAAASDPGEMYNPLFIYGSSGLGKTHLAHAIGHVLLEQNPKAHILVISSENFINEFINCSRSNNVHAMDKFRQKYRHLDALIVDDIQFLCGKDKTQEEFFYTFNQLFESNKQIVLTSDCKPEDLEQVAERLVTRFQSGTGAEICRPSEQDCISILQRKAEKLGLQMDESAMYYIAKHYGSNIRNLEGALKSILNYMRAFFDQKQVFLDLDLVTKALQSTTPKQEDKLKNTPTQLDLQEEQYLFFNKIKEVVLTHYHLQETDIMGKSRKKNIALTRQIIIYFTKKLLDFPLTKIAELMNRKDHTTMKHSIEKIEDLIEEDSKFKEELESLKEKILR